MTREPAAKDRPIEETNAELVDGLKTCRSVVENYKSLLLPSQVIATAPDGASPPGIDPAEATVSGD